MTVSNQNPVANYLIEHGDSFSFDLDDGGTTPSSIQVTIEGAATQVAWTLAGGFQSGFSGTSTKTGNVYTITLSKAAGWDRSPFTVNVDFTISGVPETESWNYELANESLYPDLMTPRNAITQGTLIVSKDGIAVRRDVGQIDIEGMTVTDTGSGRVLIVGGAGGAGGGGITSTLDATTVGTPPSLGFQVDDPTWANVTEFRISDDLANGGIVDSIFSNLVAGSQFLVRELPSITGAASAQFTVTSITDASGYWAFGVTQVGTVVSAPTLAEEYEFVFLQPYVGTSIIDEQVKADSTEATFTFATTSIPAAHDLFLVWRVKQNSGTAGNCTLQFNGDTTGNYTHASFRASTTGSVSGSGTAGTASSFIDCGLNTDTTGATEDWAVGSIKIESGGWQGTGARATAFGESWTDGTSSIPGARGVTGGSWNNAAAVTSIEFGTNQGQFLIGSMCALIAVPQHTWGAGISNVPSIVVKDEGSLLTSQATIFDFVGAGVTATNVGGVVTVTISGGGGGGSGDVVGPASATDDAIVVYDGTTGKLVKDSTGTIGQITANTAKVTNATHTGDVSGATALTIGAKKVTLAMMEDGVDGELITYDATGVAAKVAVGIATHVLTSNGTGAAPTFQAAAGGVDTTAVHKATAGEIAAMTTVTVASGDLIMIEDVSDANNKKNILASDLLGAGTDAAAIHDNVAAEISALTLVTVASGDHILIEDASDSDNKKRIAASDLLAGGVDTTAIHKATAAEISALTEKTAPLAADHLLIEDSADSNNKKRVQIGNLPGAFDFPFFVQAAAAAGTTDFYGPNSVSTTAGWPAQLVWATSWGSGATPTGATNFIGPIVPFSCNLVRMQLWVAPTGSALVEEYTIWRIPYTDGAAVGTLVQVGTTQTTASPAGGQAHNFSQTISSGNAFNAGDSFVVLRKNTSGATAATLRGTFVFEETL